MELAKQCLDVGIFTKRIDEMRAFYGERLGLEFESMLPVGGGFRQHRYLAHGSVIKLNESREPLRPRIPGGYSAIRIADSKVSAPQAMFDPDGNSVELVPPGHEGVGQIEIRLGVGDPATFEYFLAQALGAERIGAGRFKLGQTIVSFKLDAYTVHPADSPPFTNALEVVSRMAAVGIRYMTIQVRDCDAANRELTSRGARAAMAPVNLGTVARICFVRDPDGNMIEISQRAGLGNPLPAA